MVHYFEQFQPLNSEAVTKFHNHNTLLERAQDLSSDVTSELFLSAMSILRTFEYMCQIPPGFVNIPKELNDKIILDVTSLRRRQNNT